MCWIAWKKESLGWPMISLWTSLKKKRYCSTVWWMADYQESYSSVINAQSVRASFSFSSSWDLHGIVSVGLCFFQAYALSAVLLLTFGTRVQPILSFKFEEILWPRRTPETLKDTSHQRKLEFKLLLPGRYQELPDWDPWLQLLFPVKTWKSKSRETVIQKCVNADLRSWF